MKRLLMTLALALGLAATAAAFCYTSLEEWEIRLFRERATGNYRWQVNGILGCNPLDTVVGTCNYAHKLVARYRDAGPAWSLWHVIPLRDSEHGHAAQCGEDRGFNESFPIGRIAVPGRTIEITEQFWPGRITPPAPGTIAARFTRRVSRTFPPATTKAY